jgi:Flp pilus assembly pilin Flp
MTMTTTSVFRAFLDAEEGEVAIEYGLIALFLGAGIVASLQLIPPELNQIFTDIATFF